MHLLLKRFAMLFTLLTLLTFMSACGGGAYPTPGESLGDQGDSGDTSKDDTSTYTRPEYTLKLHGNEGNITVRAGNVDKPTVTASGQELIVQFDEGTKFYTVDDKKIANANVDVVVPSTISLDLKEKKGNIVVEGLSGQMTLRVDDGTITVKEAVLYGNSSVKSVNGSLYFSGVMYKVSTTTMETQSGTIEVLLPHDAPFLVEATTTSGRIASDFITVKDTKNVNEKVNGATDPAFNPVLKLKTEAGFINFHKQA